MTERYKVPENERPIAYINWFPDLKPESIAKRWPEHDGDVFERVCFSTRDFERAIAAWLPDNENAQYLIILAHGILDKSERAIGVGSSEADGAYIEWDALWNVILGETGYDLGIYLIACMGYDGAESLNAHTRLSNRNPHLVSLNCIIEGRELLVEVNRAVASLVGAIHIQQISYVDEHLIPLLAATGSLEACWPTQHDQGLSQVNVRRFKEVTGHTFQDWMRRPQSFRLNDQQPWRR